MSGKIVQLSTENVKRLKAVTVRPEGDSLVIVAGNNGNGKSSVLDSIMYALGGADKLPKKPVRHGQDKAKIVVELDELIVTRTITAAGGGTLTITNKEGLRYNSPQSILDKLTGALSFDPLDFSRQEPRQQSEVLRKIAGIDLTKDNEEKQKLFDERTQIGREVRSLESRINALPPPQSGLPEVEVSAADVLDRQKKAMDRNQENARLRQNADDAQRAVDTTKNQIQVQEDVLQDLRDQMAALQKQIGEKEGGLETLQKELAKQSEASIQASHIAANLKDEPVDGFQKEVETIDQTNMKIRVRNERAKLDKELKEKRSKHDDLTKQIDGVEARKATKVKEAKYPIAGLSVDVEGVVFFNDIPLEQASSAEQLRVSVAIGLALNPKLRVLLIRDGSLLDENSWKLLEDLATEADAQVWIEKVGTTGEVSVIIEDGMVKA